MAKAEASTDPRGQFRVNEKSFIGHTLIEEGGTAFIHPDDLKVKGKPDSHIGENLSPLNDVAQAMIDGQKEDHPDKSKAKPAKAGKGKDPEAAGAGAEPAAGGAPAAGAEGGDLA